MGIDSEKGRVSMNKVHKATIRMLQFEHMHMEVFNEIIIWSGWHGQRWYQNLFRK